MEAAAKVSKAFCTTREAAQMLGVSVRTVQLWAESGTLRAWKTGGGHRRISLASVEKARALEQDAPSVPATPTARGLTILAVDSDGAVLALYKQNLDRWPIKSVLVMARSGSEALVRLGLTRPDLLIADLHLPDWDGGRIVEVVRAIPELSSVTAVLVSDLDPGEIALHGRIPDRVPVLPKPVPFDRLLDIATVLADRKHRTV